MTHRNAISPLGLLAAAAALTGCAMNTTTATTSPTVQHVIVLDTSQQFISPRAVGVYGTKQACLDALEKKMVFLGSKGSAEPTVVKDPGGGDSWRLNYQDNTWTRFTCSFTDGTDLSAEATKK